MNGQHGGTPDLAWDDVKNFFDPDLLGALSEVSAVDASMEDWQAVFDLVRSSLEGGVAGPLPAAVEVLMRPTDVETAALVAHCRLRSGGDTKSVAVTAEGECGN
ncbi:hypothetical protein AB0P15_32500 [Streptomyces sp. NPDC087917]|uniref:hypothetical protein n=1 Tax=Streptomyces sp. NPDC087917 TaxID=3155060 RepID=UPI003417BA68